MQRILVIDDDENLRDTIGVMLERENFAPLFAGDGKSGFDKAISLKPNLVLVDLRLPEMSGVDVCKRLRADHVTTPIIVLSAIGDEMDKVLLLEIGADDYMVKAVRHTGIAGPHSRTICGELRKRLRLSRSPTLRSISNAGPPPKPARPSG